MSSKVWQSYAVNISGSEHFQGKTYYFFNFLLIIDLFKLFISSWIILGRKCVIQKSLSFRFSNLVQVFNVCSYDFLNLIDIYCIYFILYFCLLVWVISPFICGYLGNIFSILFILSLIPFLVFTYVSVISTLILIISCLLFLGFYG